MTALKENLLYVLLPGLKAKALETIETVYAYVDKETLSPRPVKAPTFFAPVLHAADLEAAAVATADAGDVRSCVDTFPDPPTAEDWQRMEPDISWSECVRRAEACIGMAKEADISEMATPSTLTYDGSDSPSSSPGSSALVDAEEGNSLVSFLEVSPTPDADGTSIILQEKASTPAPEVNIEKIKMDKAIVEWTYDTLHAMVQIGAVVNPRPRDASATSDRYDAVLTMLDVLQHTSFPAPAPILALWYIQELAFDTTLMGSFAYAICADRAITTGDFCLRMFVAGMMLADKMLNDHTYNLKTWLMLSDIPVSVLFKMEIASLTVFGHDLTISPQAWENHLTRLMEQNAKIVAAIGRVAPLPSSVVVGFLLRDLLGAARASRDSAEPLFLGPPALTSNVTYLEKMWAGNVPAPTSVAVVRRGQITFTSATAAAAAVPSTSTLANVPPEAASASPCYHKRKASSSPEWSTAGDAPATPITRKAPRTMHATAIGAERERIRLAKVETSRGTVAKQLSAWGAVQPWTPLQGMHPTRELLKPAKQASGAPLRASFRVAPLTSIRGL